MRSCYLQPKEMNTLGLGKHLQEREDEVGRNRNVGCGTGAHTWDQHRLVTNV